MSSEQSLESLKEELRTTGTIVEAHLEQVIAEKDEVITALRLGWAEVRRELNSKNRATVSNKQLADELESVLRTAGCKHLDCRTDARIRARIAELRSCRATSTRRLTTF